MNYSTFLFVMLGLMSTMIVGDNCPYEECECLKTEILCDYRGMEVIPQKRFNNSPVLMSLDLDGNEITTIPAGSLPANLTVISLQSNPIETIDDTAFDESIYTLQDLTFKEARFTQIPQAVFHLKALKSLQIYQTNILVWNENDMNQLGSTLETLDLDTVGLTSWPTWMKSMTNLTVLTISGCPISSIPDDALELFANTLTYLILSNTSLTTLPKSLSKMKVLSLLSLDNNNIIDVIWLPQLSHLSSLYLNDNKIKDSQKLSSVLRNWASTLDNLDIQNNSLTSIPELSFLTQISYLDFTFNHLSDANSGSLPPNLTQLSMDNNFLSSIPSIMSNLMLVTNLFLNSNNIQFVQGSHIPMSVQDLDLGFNSISQLTRSSFPVNSNINFLSLNNNPLSTISLDAFNNLAFLTQLNLQRTKLTRLPLALASLRKLYYFDISDSADLVCTCQEQSLRPWIESIGLNGTIGNCGMTSVYFFFTALSAACPQI